MLPLSYTLMIRAGFGITARICFERVEDSSIGERSRETVDYKASTTSGHHLMRGYNLLVTGDQLRDLPVRSRSSRCIQPPVPRSMHGL